MQNHPLDTPAGLLNSLLCELDNQEMAIKELRHKLSKFDYKDKAVTAIEQINKQ